MPRSEEPVNGLLARAGRAGRQVVSARKEGLGPYSHWQSPAALCLSGLDRSRVAEERWHMERVGLQAPHGGLDPLHLAGLRHPLEKSTRKAGSLLGS
jgi:hypothetical protein